MVIFGFELVEHVLNHAFFVDQEANTVKTIVHFTHEKLPLEDSFDFLPDEKINHLKHRVNEIILYSTFYQTFTRILLFYRYLG
ncbi:hypothetical protein THOD04_80035 [Vibrio owensii]|nr:hypothetical protein THOD04_80035 [Vibrio owensii]